MGSEEIIKFIFGALGAMTLYIVKDLSGSVKSATREISDLNNKISVLIHKGDRNEKEIEKLYSESENIRKQMQSVRERIHELGNSMNGLNLAKNLDWVKQYNNKE